MIVTIGRVRKGSVEDFQDEVGVLIRMCRGYRHEHERRRPLETSRLRCQQRLSPVPGIRLGIPGYAAKGASRIPNVPRATKRTVGAVTIGGAAARVRRANGVIMGGRGESAALYVARGNGAGIRIPNPPLVQRRRDRRRPERVERSRATLELGTLVSVRIAFDGEPLKSAS